MKVHTFDSTSEAYNASQTDDNIKDGDVLSVPSEGIHGVLVKAWPVAVTADHGAFHALEDGVKWESYEGGRYFEAASHAALIGVPAYATEPTSAAEPEEEPEPESDDAYADRHFREVTGLAPVGPEARAFGHAVGVLIDQVAELHRIEYDPDYVKPVEPILAKMERELRALRRPRTTLSFKFEEDQATGEPYAVVDGVMTGPDRGIYMTQSDGRWVKQGAPEEHRTPDWLVKALNAAWESYWETAEKVRAAEAAAGWDATP